VLLVAKAQVKGGLMRQRMRPALGNVDAPAGLTAGIVCLDLLTPTEPMPGGQHRRAWPAIMASAALCRTCRCGIPGGATYIGELPVISQTGNLTHLAWRTGSRHFVHRTGCAVTPDDEEYRSQVGKLWSGPPKERKRRFWIKRMTIACWAEPIKTPPSVKTSWSHNDYGATQVLYLLTGN
jgi:hypothetical protein